MEAQSASVDALAHALERNEKADNEHEKGSAFRKETRN